jgi:predicted ATP-dependent serine protease
MYFETIGLKGPYANVFGDPAPNFAAMVYGKAGAGKSTMSYGFADYFARNHGDVLYVAREESVGKTLQDKLRRVGSPHHRLRFTDRIDTPEMRDAQLVVIDSVSEDDMSPDAIKDLRRKHPRTGFLFVFHATKDGKFRGATTYEHAVDIVIKVADGIASNDKNRFGSKGEMPVNFGNAA